MGRDWHDEVVEVNSVQASTAVDSEGAYGKQRFEHGDQRVRESGLADASSQAT